jgi:aspartyl-tRNA(Asn)/glutamyl-tRNA(Gln) amidotransferase subunit A
MDTPLHKQTLTEALAGLAQGRFTTEQLQQSVLDEINAQNPELNAYLDYNKNVVGVSEGLLHGVPIAVKDNILTTDLVTTASSKVLEGYKPQYDATLISHLRKAGAHIVGKTNLDAWAHGSSTETSDFGPTRNPRNPEYTPGGSSGGSAAAVAADLCIAAVGTETSGSIRTPAAWCGIVGVKPTYGRVSRSGVVAMGSSLDCPGPMTKTVEDGALMLNILAGNDPYDGTTSPREVEDFRALLGKSIKGMKIGVVYMDIDGLEPVREYYENAFSVLRELGAVVEVTHAMSPEYAIGLYAVIQRSEVSSNLARYDGIRYGKDRSFFGKEAKRRIMMGTYTLSKGYADKYYATAQKVRTLYIQDFEKLFSKYDVLVAPTAPGFALKVGESEKHPFFGEMVDMLIEPCSTAGLPGVSVPCYTDPKTNLSLGLHVMSPAWQEARALQVAHAFEQATEWNAWATRVRKEQR